MPAEPAPLSWPPAGRGQLPVMPAEPPAPSAWPSAESGRSAAFREAPERMVRHEPGTRWPTSSPDATGWPQSQPPAQWPPPLSPGPDGGLGWPDDDDRRQRAESRDRRAGSRRGGQAAQPARRGGWRTYLLAGMVLALVTAGLGGAMWRGGWLSQDSGKRAAPRPVTVVPRASAPAGPQPSASVAAPVTVVEQGAGTFTDVNSAGRILGTAGSLRRFRIAIENGINEDPDTFAEIVDQVLGDQRSWIAGGEFRLQRVPRSAPAEFTIYLASPVTSEAMCAAGGLHTERFTSCRLDGKVIINDARWLTAIPDYGAPLEIYQAYAINHEVGHQLGHGHEACEGTGQPAPVMQQQTYGLKGCVANPWPFLNGRRYSGPPIP